MFSGKSTHIATIWVAQPGSPKRGDMKATSGIIYFISIDRFSNWTNWELLVHQITVNTVESHLETLFLSPYFKILRAEFDHVYHQFSDLETNIWNLKS